MPSQASLTLFLALLHAVPSATMLSLAALAGLQKYSIWFLASLHVPTRVVPESAPLAPPDARQNVASKKAIGMDCSMVMSPPSVGVCLASDLMRVYRVR